MLVMSECYGFSLTKGLSLQPQHEALFFSILSPFRFHQHWLLLHRRVSKACNSLMDTHTNLEGADLILFNYFYIALPARPEIMKFNYVLECNEFMGCSGEASGKMFFLFVCCLG